MLTHAQAQLLAFINEYQDDNFGVSPSFEEMKDGIYLKSKSGVHRLISALVERGFIRRLPNRARALEVIEQVPPPPPTGLALYTSQMLIAELAARSERARRDQEVMS